MTHGFPTPAYYYDLRLSSLTPFFNEGVLSYVLVIKLNLKLPKPNNGIEC